MQNMKGCAGGKYWQGSKAGVIDGVAKSPIIQRKRHIHPAALITSF